MQQTRTENSTSHYRKNGLWWSNSVHGYYISPYLKYRKVFFPCPNFILRNMVTKFFHLHILSSAICHPHFIIRQPPPIVGKLNTDHQAPQKQSAENCCHQSQSSGHQGSIWAWFPRRLLSSPGRLVEPGFRSFLRQSENQKRGSWNSKEKRMDTATDELGERAEINSTWSDRVEDHFKKK